MIRYSAWIVACGLLVPSLNAEEPRYEKRWFYASNNLLVKENADKLCDLIAQAGKSNYNGLMLADYKFNILERMPDRYFQNVERVKQAAKEAKIEIIPAVCPIGYSSGIMAHDPNLAAGLPVKDAPFVVRGQKAEPLSAAKPLLANGELEEAKGDAFRGFSFQDEPGKASFVDSETKHGGKSACRMTDVGKISESGNCRLSQKVSVRPFACYRLSCWVKTQDLQSPGTFKLLALGRSAAGRSLTHYESNLKGTQDWTKMDVVFNSLHEQEIQIYAGMWGGKLGTLWIDDMQLEELSLVNLLRRPGCPLVVKGKDGTVFEEGRDFEPVADAKLGQVPYAGEFNFDHAGAEIRLTANSRIKPDQELLVSWYHPVLIHGWQVPCSLIEPKVFELVQDQVKRVNDLFQPKTFFMSHDEIRVGGWSELSVKSGKTPGQLLADNVKKCYEIIRKTSPKAEVVVWSDMFDPNHNAQESYYLINGSLLNSWEGLPKEVIIANWNGGKAAVSMKWFADRGHRQILAGYYDGGVDNFHRWNTAAQKVPGVVGFMYTTWQANYTLLDEYGKLMNKP